MTDPKLPLSGSDTYTLFVLLQIYGYHITFFFFCEMTIIKVSFKFTVRKNFIHPWGAIAVSFIT